MIKLSLYILFIAVILLCSCANNDKKNDYKIQITKRVYEMDFFPNHMYSGILFDRELNQELLYFGDLVTTKKIVFFDLEGTKIHTVHLKDAVKNSLYGINNISVVSMDTILLLENYTNTLVLVNSKGEELKKIDLSLYHSDQYLVEFNSSIFGDFSYNFARDGIFLYTFK